MEEGIQSVLDAIERTGRIFSIRNGECNTRCPFCGDSTKSSQSKHFYISLTGSHPCFCQRCNYRSGSITSEVLEALGAAERDASVYVRQVMKAERLSGRSRRSGPTLGLGRAQRLVIPQPDRSNPDDAAAVGYIEGRLGGAPLEAREIERYRLVTCGLFGLLAANGIDELTLDPRQMREADRLNETCVGFLSADESYVIFRTMDDEYVRRGGRRYTNYRIYREWEGSKSFACRADVGLLVPRHRVVCSEGIIDLIQIERQFYPEARWLPDHVGMATCGASHETVFRQLFGLGFLSLDAELYIDNEPGMLQRARRLPQSSPFGQTGGFSLAVYANAFPGEKDFGVLPEKIRRVRAS